MLTFEDCLALCDLTEEEIAAVAEHEHLPAMAALELANYIVHTDDGDLKLKKIIIDDIERAKSHGNVKHMHELQAVLKQFVLTHPKLQTLAEKK